MKNKVRKIFALMLTLALLIQSTDFSVFVAKADETTAYKDLEGLIWTNETTNQIIKMYENGLNLETFFEGDLVSDITIEDLYKWQEEGTDINDVVLKRAKERSATVTYDTDDTVYIGKDEEGNDVYEYSGPVYYASADSDGKYYLTDCYLPDDKGTVNLAGTSYSGALYNPKDGSTGTSTPWYITLGNDEAMCLTYNGSASTSKSHSYAKGSISSLKSNQYFAGGSSYPIEDYLRGAVYAYERIMGLQGLSDYQFSAPAGSIDAGLEELYRKAGKNMVYYSG